MAGRPHDHTRQAPTANNLGLHLDLTSRYTDGMSQPVVINLADIFQDAYRRLASLIRSRLPKIIISCSFLGHGGIILLAAYILQCSEQSESMLFIVLLSTANKTLEEIEKIAHPVSPTHFLQSRPA